MSKREEYIKLIVNSNLYNSGRDFTPSDMFVRVKEVNNIVEMRDVLRLMSKRKLVHAIMKTKNLRYRKARVNFIREPWISEVAQDLCAGDYDRVEPGQARRDAISRARALESANQETRRASL
jgi:hypothetical protein